MRTDKIYLIALIVVLFFFGLREGCNRREMSRLVVDVAKYSTEAQTYKTKLGLQVSTNDALVLQTQEQIKALVATNDTLREWIEDFKNIKASVVIKEVTVIREVPVPFDRPIPCEFSPFAANKISKDFEFYSTVENTGLTIDSLKVPNVSTIVVGQKRSGFLGLKSSMVVDVNNSNPYIQTSNISGYVYEPEKKWHEKILVNLAAGAFVGYVVGRGTQ
jgi:hypothetical protein